MLRKSPEIPGIFWLPILPHWPTAPCSLSQVGSSSKSPMDLQILFPPKCKWSSLHFMKLISSKGYDISRGFFLGALYQVEEAAFHSQFVVFLSWRAVEFCHILFLSLLRWSCEFFSVVLVWCIILFDFWMLNQPHISEINPIRSRWITLFLCCLIRFASVLLKIFMSIFIRDISLQSFAVFFLEMSLPGFDISKTLASQNKLGSVFSPLLLLRRLYKGLVFILHNKISGITYQWSHLNYGFSLWKM